MDKDIRFLSEQTTENVDYLRDRISFSKKKANNFRWAKNKLDYFDTFDVLFSNEAARIERNEQIYNGYWDLDEYKYIENPFGLADYTTPAKLEHVDIISLPLREIVGSELKRPFNITAVAINSEAASKRRRERLKLVKDYVYQQALGPLIQEVQAKYQQMLEAGEITEEQVKQGAQQEIDAMTPEDISKYMSESFKLPEETLAQKLVNHLIKDLKVQYKFNQGWRNAVLHAKEVYRIGKQNGSPTLEVIDIDKVTYDKSQNVDFIQDGDWACAEEVLLISDVYDKYGEFFTESDRNKLDNYFDVNFRNEGGLLINQPVLLDTQMTSQHKSVNRRVRCLHCAWKSLKKIKFITSITPDGVTEEFIVDETYVRNPETDIEETVTWIPEVWEGTKIGTDVYVNMGPIPNQYRDLNRPFHVKLPYYGLIYGSKIAEPISLLERGLDWQFTNNVIWFRLQEALATDKGNILLGLMKQIPKGMEPSAWLQSVATTKLALIDPTQDVSPVGTDPQYWKSINLSNGQDIQKFINLLEYCEQRCIRTIGSNENRIGNNSAYETVTNNQQKLIQSSNITEPEFFMHNLLKEEVMTGLLEQAKLCYRENPKLISYVLDDFSAGDLMLDPELLNSSEFGVYLSNSTEDQQTIQALRMELRNIIQASNGDLRIIGELITTKNPADIKRMIDTVALELKQQQQQQQQMQQQMQQEQLQHAAEQAELERKDRQLDRENRLKEATIRAMGYSGTGDVDMNQVPDVLEMSKFNADMTLKAEAQQIKREELALRTRELEENNQSEERDRQVELEKARIKERSDREKNRSKAIESKKK